MRSYLVAAVMFLACAAHAQTVTNAQSARLVVPYKTSCSSVTIGVAATEVSGNSLALSTSTGISAIAIMNLDTANTVYCSDNASVSSSGNNIGWPIAYSASTVARNWMEWGISMTQKWYCVSSGANTSIMVCKVR